MSLTPGTRLGPYEVTARIGVGGMGEVYRARGVERASSWAATTPTLLVKEGYFTNPGGFIGRPYDVSHDGQRFLMIKEGGGTGQTAAPPQLIVVQHWVEELKRLVPTN